MKKFTKLLALILALAMTMAVFSACGSDKDEKDDDKDGKSKKTEQTSGDSKKSGKNGPEEVADEFMSAYLSFDADEMKDALDYIDPSSDAYDEISDGIDSLSTVFDSDAFGNILYESMDLEDSFGSNAYLFEDDVDDFINGLKDTIVDAFKSIKKKSSYTIDDVSDDGDKATVSITCETVDPDYFDADFDDIMGGNNIEDMFNFDPDDFISYITNEKGISQDDLQYLTEDEVLSYTYSYMSDKGIISDIFDNIIDVVDDYFNNFDIKEYDVTLTLEKDGNDWLITDAKGF